MAKDTATAIETTDQKFFKNSTFAYDVQQFHVHLQTMYLFNVWSVYARFYK